MFGFGLSNIFLHEIFLGRYYFLPNEYEKYIYFNSSLMSGGGDFRLQVKQVEDCQKPLASKSMFFSFLRLYFTISLIFNRTKFAHTDSVREEHSQRAGSNSESELPGAL